MSRQRFRVYYEDTDAGGVVFYANYLKFIERGRTEYLRELGFEQSIQTKEKNLVFVVRSLSADYLSPAFLDDMIEVQTSIKLIKNASLIFAQKILNLEKNTVLFNAEVKVVSVLKNNLKPCAFPQEILENLMEENSLSIVSLIFNAGLVVQLVMIILVLMSIYSWTVIMSKKKILMDASNDIEIFHEEFERNDKLAALYKNLPPLASDWTAMEDIFGSGYKEFTHTKSTTNQSLIMNSERAYRSMNTSASNEIDRLDSSLSILAMIASSSPYIGLFGTVWGIMHSFIGLASVKQATIAVVAPGIAEALIATAFGLFAAIPATIAYNRLVSQVEEIGNKYTAFVEEIFVILQRQK
tara:strand:+ start:1414 stop:2475 length:1062 start_codon:yes stop_codon:yes gene_type:complete